MPPVINNCNFAIYTSVACNRSPHCLDWGKNDYIIYGACHAVILYKPKERHGGTVEQTLIFHTKPVTSVRWIQKGNDPETELLSTSADHTAVIWSAKDDGTFASTALRGHSNVVETASAVYLKHHTGDLLVATASADSTVKIWKRDRCACNCIQTIAFDHGFATEVKLTVLGSPPNLSEPLLAAASDDFKVRLYVQNQDDEFILLTSLSGHEDWVRGLDFIRTKDDILLATGSQDSTIRIWRISGEQHSEECSTLPRTLKLQKSVLNTPSGKRYYVSLVSVLLGHENWIYSVQWQPRKTEDKKAPLQLLSVSIDQTMIFWEHDPISQLWIEQVQVGNIGGKSLGFYGGVFSPDCNKVAAYGYQGAIHVWDHNKELQSWESSVGIGGHFGPVKDVAWDPKGAYLLSCSQDQTTRLHARWSKDSGQNCWYEVARPQVHGYDMVCLTVLSRYKFVSGADEKILRAFQAPLSFAENLMRISNIDTSAYLNEKLPEGASVPALGLTNKPVFEDDIINAKKAQKEQKHAKDLYPEFCYTPVSLTAPPTEELLLQNTLWAEVQKLYGHPYEVFAVAANHQGTVVASACKASKVEHAAIILWSTCSWQIIGKLKSHALTVTQLEFSPNDEFLLSVSRDRTWILYRNFPGRTPSYKKIASLDKKTAVHSRIIWSCSWSHDNLYFATASRDKKVAVWGKNLEAASEPSFSLSSVPLEVEDAATAVSFAPYLSTNQRYIIAVGLENGRIFLYTWRNSEPDSIIWNLQFMMDKNYSHHLSVNRLKFSPRKITDQSGNEEPENLLLASCGNDHLLRIYSFPISSFCLKL